jgi:hypothetical protein
MRYIRKNAFINATQWTGENYDDLFELTDKNVVFSDHTGLLYFDGCKWGPVAVGSYFIKRNGAFSVFLEGEFNSMYEVAE